MSPAENTLITANPYSISPFPPAPVPCPLNYQSWRWLTFLHWPYEPDLLRPLVPQALELELFDGASWVGVVPFEVRGLRAPWLPPVPWLSYFPETNLRTYVRNAKGVPGVWFFSLDAARYAAVIAARASYGLPYAWSDMDLSRQGGLVRYRSVRRRPAANARTDILIEPGDPFKPDELGDRDHFLTARFRLYTRIDNRLAHADVQHQPWPLTRARVLRLEQSLTTAAGLPDPAGDPLVHYSPGVDVGIAAPEYC
ncbi:MAG: DUF2071 domain-containing protein [Acidobacteria bacterium]|nr:DUF2071 domain-containing protein [Acidobacteriota bacterium]